MGLLDGLERLGIKNVDADDLYGEKKPEKKSEKAAVKEEKSSTVDERELLLKRSYECPVCNYKFKDLALKSGRARIIGTEKNLRPRYDGIEPLKYEAVVCPRCGYAVMARFMGPLAPTQKKAVQNQISRTFKGKITEQDAYTYAEALERITLVLASTIVKRAKASEKAYTCLKGGWLCEAYLDTLDIEDPKKEILIEELSEKKKEFLDYAYEGFVAAMQSESFPIAGMDEVTLDYLIAEMAYERGAYDVSAKLIASILQSRTASSRIKDKTLELKDEVAAAIRASKAKG